MVRLVEVRRLRDRVEVDVIGRRVLVMSCGVRSSGCGVGRVGCSLNSFRDWDFPGLS